jgi:hypothetical protein
MQGTRADHAEASCAGDWWVLSAARQRHHQRRHDEMQRVVEAENQGDRHDRFLAEGQQRQARSHIADIAVGGGESLDCAFGDIAAGAQDAR